jgi:hypothetical protein
MTTMSAHPLPLSPAGVLQRNTTAFPRSRDHTGDCEGPPGPLRTSACERLREQPCHSRLLRTTVAPGSCCMTIRFVDTLEADLLSVFIDDGLSTQSQLSFAEYDEANEHGVIRVATVPLRLFDWPGPFTEA